IDREEAAVREYGHVLHAHRAAHGMDDVLQVATEERLTTRERNHERIEEPRRIGERLRFRGARRRVGSPIVAESAPRVAPQRHLEVDEDRTLARGQPGVLREENRYIPGREARGQHVTRWVDRYAAPSPFDARCRSPRRRGVRRRYPGRSSGRVG